MLSRREERLQEREMWSLNERKGLQKGRCGLQERGTAYIKIKKTRRDMLTKRYGIYVHKVEMKVDIDLRLKAFFVHYLPVTSKKKGKKT